MEQVTMWKTSDGQLFSNWTDAKAHEDNIQASPEASGKASQITDSYFRHFSNGDWVHINTEDETWEYDRNDDPDTYMSGCYGIDDDNNVIDYDGCYELPRSVIQALAEMGYNTKEISTSIEENN